MPTPAQSVLAALENDENFQPGIFEQKVSAIWMQLCHARQQPAERPRLRTTRRRPRYRLQKTQRLPKHWLKTIRGNLNNTPYGSFCMSLGGWLPQQTP